MGPRRVTPSRWGAVLQQPSLLYALFLCALGFAFLISWPIVLTDTDLWFHLDWGRYLFDQRAIPSTSYFSFLSPPREWVNYSWLFQAVVYLCHAQFGYYGLIALRSFLYLATFVLILRYLWIEQDCPSSRGWRAFLFALTWLVLLSRYQSVRPFLFTDLFLVIFLYVLEYHPRRAILLAGIAVLWCNIHGVAYPIMLLLLGSYVLEYVRGRVRGRPYSARDERRFFVPVVLSMLAVFATPHGIRLLGAPFRPLGFQSQFTSELWTYNVQGLLSLQLVGMVPSYGTVRNVILLLVGLGVLVACLTRRVRLSHLVIAAFGLFLATKGNRFVPECALLALPLLKNLPIGAGQTRGEHVPRVAWAVLVGLLMVIPVKTAASAFRHRPAFPFSHRGLPEGIATFLDHVNVGGDVLNHPNMGGYLRWRLYPRQRIFMDMEFLFEDEDLYLAARAFSDREALRKVLARYDPPFITVPILMSDFRELIEPFPRYVLVFFDDGQVLYVNRERYPAIAEQYALHDVDPYELARTPMAEVLEQVDVASLLPSLGRLIEIYPDGVSTHQLAAVWSNQEGVFDRALTHAEAIVRNVPGLPIGYRLQGEALAGLGRSDEALSAYAMALRRLDWIDRREVDRAMGRIHLDEGRYAQAYQHFRRGVDPFASNTTIEDLYHFGLAARLAGEPRVAEAVLTYLYKFRLAPDEAEWIGKVRADLAGLGVVIDEEE